MMWIKLGHDVFNHLFCICFVDSECIADVELALC